jgi:hypothetical protein
MNKSEKVLVALQNAAKQSDAIAETMEEVVKAQNITGVMAMTTLQLMLEKGMVTREEIDRRFDLNKAIVLTEDGGCKVALSKLLDGIGEVKK